MDLGAILLSLLIAGVVKLLVMVLAVRLVLRLYGATHLHEAAERPWLLLPEEALPEVRVLWWSLVLFAASELFCGVEIYVLFRSNAAMGALHALASGLGMALFAFGMLRFLDRKFLHYGGDRCLANRVCRGCTIEATEGCKFRVFLMLVATFAALAAMGAWLAPTARMYADMRRYTLPLPDLNAWFDATVVPWMLANIPGYDPSGRAFFIPEAEFLLEFRVFPTLALVLSGVAIGLLRAGREHRGLEVLSFAVGLLCYTYFEIFLYPATGDALLGSLGHEVVELWFLLAISEFLVRSYGEPAGGGGDEAPAAPEAMAV